MGQGRGERWGWTWSPQWAGGAAEAATWGSVCTTVPDSPNCGISSERRKARVPEPVCAGDLCLSSPAGPADRFQNKAGSWSWPPTPAPTCWGLAAFAPQPVWGGGGSSAGGGARVSLTLLGEQTHPKQVGTTNKPGPLRPSPTHLHLAQVAPTQQITWRCWPNGLASAHLPASSSARRGTTCTPQTCVQASLKPPGWQ